MKNSFATPPHINDHEGNPRQAGFEFELAGIEPKDAAQLVADLFGGTLNRKHSLDLEVNDTKFGTFSVELDASMVKELSARLETQQPASPNDLIDMNQFRASVSSMVGSIAGQVVPCEIVTPPIPLEKLPMLEELNKALRDRQALGTKASFTHAFGMHINPSIASTDVSYLLNTMRAFLLLYPWLLKALDVDLSRRLLTFINPFPENYALHILPAQYTPTLDSFIEDYLHYNPTRNRALDYLPLFSYLKPEKLNVLKPTALKLVKARPTFHYRLPNCEIDNPHWSIAREWNIWVELEKLAGDEEKLKAMSHEYYEFLQKPLHGFSSEWVASVTEKYGFKNV